MVYIPWENYGICKFWMLKRCYDGSRCRWEHPEPTERKRLWDDHTAKQEEDQRLRGIPKLVNPNPKKHGDSGGRDRELTPPWSRPVGRVAKGHGLEERREYSDSPPPRHMDRPTSHDNGGPYGTYRALRPHSLSPLRYPEIDRYERDGRHGLYGPHRAPLLPALPPQCGMDGEYEQDRRGRPSVPHRAPPAQPPGRRFTREDSPAMSPDAARYSYAEAPWFCRKSFDFDLADERPSAPMSPRGGVPWTRKRTVRYDAEAYAPEVSMLDVPPSPLKDGGEEPVVKHYSNANSAPLGKANRLRENDEEQTAAVWTGERFRNKAAPRKAARKELSSDVPSTEAITLWKRSEITPDCHMTDGAQEHADDNYDDIGGYWGRWRDRQKAFNNAEEETKQVADMGREVEDSKPEQTMSRDTSDLTHAEPQAACKSTSLLPPPTTSIKLIMGATKRLSNGETKHVGPHPSTIRISAPYCSQEALNKQLEKATATNSSDHQERSIAAAREDTVRLQGCTWIDNVRRALQLPVRTYTTACVYYHKFRLAHPGSLNGLEYGTSAWADACAASLLTACKVEDTLKKSRDILAAAYNLKASAHDQLGSDDAVFEAQSRAVIGLERLVLEAGGFDFRSRYPHRLLVKIAKTMPEGEDDERMKVSKVAWTILTDLHRTFAPLKQTSATLAFASMDLAAQLVAGASPNNTSAIRDELQQYDIKAWSTSRAEVMETLQDLLELYTDHTSNTILGTKYSLDDFVRTRLTYKKEVTANEPDLPRYTKAPSRSEQNGQANGISTLRVANGHPTPVSPGDTQQPVGVQAPNQQQSQVTQQDGAVGTLRFMLNPQLASDEKAEVQKFFIEEWEEYEEEIEVPIPRSVRSDRSGDRGPLPSGPPRDGVRSERDGVRGGKPDERAREAERERTRLRDRDRERDGRRFEERRFEERDRRFDRRYDDRRYEDERRGRGRDERR